MLVWFHYAAVKFLEKLTETFLKVTYFNFERIFKATVIATKRNTLIPLFPLKAPHHIALFTTPSLLFLISSTRKIDRMSPQTFKCVHSCRCNSSTHLLQHWNISCRAKPPFLPLQLSLYRAYVCVCV